MSATVSGSASTLESLPGAEAVMFLDFDGQYVVSPYWNNGDPIDAEPSGMDDEMIRETWEMISEDFSPFRVNVTTNEAVFLAAPANKRMRCIFTPTTTAYPGAGGVAYIGSFIWGNDVPCWVFNYGAKYAGEAGSHELGHTVGLGHDGRTNPLEEYYYGQGNWAPIMGVAYYVNTGQFSKGEYANASDTYDDLYHISENYIPYRTDDHGSLSQTPTRLVPNGNTVSVTGLIETTTDVDAFVFQTTGGNTVLTINPALVHPDLDIKAVLYNASGQVVATSNPFEMAVASFNLSLTGGVYYLSVEGVGEGDPYTTGYSDYGSLGKYSIKGSGNFIPVCLPLLTVTSAALEVCVGKSTVLTATGNSTKYTWSPYISLNTISGSSVIASPLVNTTYTVTGTIAGCAYPSMRFITITVNSLPVVSVTPSSVSICNGTSVPLVADGALTYIWGPSNGLNTIYGPSVVASPSVTTLYSVSGTSLKGCVNTAKVKVNVGTTCGVTVWFRKPSTIQAPKIHYWNTVPTNESSVWPGVLMSLDATKGPNWYKYVVGNNATKTNLLFHDNAGYQTPDMLDILGGCYDGNTSQWVNCNENYPPVLTINPKGGTYTSVVGVTLSATDDYNASPKIYYTLNGSTPTTLSSSFTSQGTINITTTSTLKAISVDNAGNVSALQSETYTITDGKLSVWLKRPSGIQAPRIHYWNALPSQTASVWPGLLMTQDLTKGIEWYKYTLNNTTFASLLFHDNANFKTADLLSVTGGCFDGSTNKWVSCDKAVVVWFKKPTNIQAPRIHYWNGVPSEPATAWPGFFMFQDSNKGANWYKYTITNATVTSLLFHDYAGYQTADQHNITGGCYDGNTNQWISCSSARIEADAEPTESLSDWSLYPNPATESVTIEYNSVAAGLLEIKITNVLGGEVHKELTGIGKGVFSKSYNTSNYKSGIYIVSVNNGSSISFKQLNIK